MGGYSTIGRAAFDLAEKGLQKVSSKFSGGAGEALAESSQKFLSKTFGLESTLTGKSGEFATSKLKEFESEFDKQLAIGTQSVKQQNLAGQVPRHVIEIQARRNARSKVFGQNDEILSAIVHAKTMEHGENSAKNLVDNLGVYFHEQVKQGDSGQFGAKLTSNLRKNPLTKEMNFNPSPYNKREFFNDHPGIETRLHSFGSAALAFKAGLAHTTTPLNGLIGNSLASFAKSTQHFFGPGYDAAKTELQTMNALGSIWADELDQMYKFRNGIISKYLPNSLGEFIHKNWQIPGFSALRQRTATMFAMQGKYSALEYSKDLIGNDPDKARKAGNSLQWLGINPKDVISNNGQLTQDQIRQAMFENTNQKLFIQGSQRNRSQWSTASPIGRITSMYHGYGAAQANFIQRELYRAVFIQKDPMSAIKTLSILGVVFPAVGTAVHGLETVWNHPSKSHEEYEDAKDKIGRLLDPSELALGDRLEGIANTAGFGVMNSYTRAAGRRKLLNNMAGPVINAAAEIGEDAANINPSKDASKGEDKVKSWEPLARDVLHDIPSLGIGSWLADRYLPTQQKLNSQKPMTSRRLAAQRAAKRRKIKESK